MPTSDNIYIPPPPEVRIYRRIPYNSTLALIFNHLAAGFFRFRPKLAGLP